MPRASLVESASSRLRQAAARLEVDAQPYTGPPSTRWEAWGFHITVRRHAIQPALPRGAFGRPITPCESPVISNRWSHSDRNRTAVVVGDA